MAKDSHRQGRLVVLLVFYHIVVISTDSFFSHTCHEIEVMVNAVDDYRQFYSDQYRCYDFRENVTVAGDCLDLRSSYFVEASRSLDLRGCQQEASYNVTQLLLTNLPPSDRHILFCIKRPKTVLCDEELDESVCLFD